MEMTDGSIVKLDSSNMILAAERALLLLSLTVVVFAGSPAGLSPAEYLAGDSLLTDS